jgi:hypothetical protein
VGGEAILTDATAEAEIMFLMKPAVVSALPDKVVRALAFLKFQYI